MNKKRSCEDCGGFTLIELMVTMAISLLITGVVYSMHISTQTFYNNQNRLLERQQNSRSSMFFVSRELRMAGYGSAEGAVTYYDTTTKTSQTLNMTQIIQDAGDPGGTPDSLVIFSGDPLVSTTLSTDMSSYDSNLKVDSLTGFTVGDHVMISDGNKAVLIEVTAIDPLNNILAHTAETGINPPAGTPFSSTFLKGTHVFRFRSYKFCVSGEQLFFENAATYLPAMLAGTAPGTGADIVADNILNMQLNYVFEDLDESPTFSDTDADATNDYADVRSIRISIRSVATDLARNVLTKDQTKVTRIRNLNL